MTDNIDNPDGLPPGTPSYIKPFDLYRRQLSPIGLYSHAADVVGRMPQMKGTPQQFKAMLMKQGVKPDELKHSGYDEKFAGRPLVTKDELAQHFNRSLPKVQETVLSAEHPADYAGRRDRPIGAAPPTKYHQYALPGGKNYREVLLHLPPPAYVPFSPVEGPAYRSSHWDTPNVLAHLRMSDRKGPKGEKILHLEELQSDWAQEGRKRGFADAAGNDSLNTEAKNVLENAGLGAPRDLQWMIMHPTDPDNRPRLRFLRNHFGDAWVEKVHAAMGAGKLPAAPYVDSTQKWLDLGLKRVLHEAAKGGYDKVVVTPGEEQAKRYDLSKHIEDLTLHGAGDNMRLSATDKNGRKVIDMQHVTEKTLADHVGKEVAEKLLSQPEPNPKNPYAARNLFGADLKIGGEGMKAFYDKLLPQALEKLAKKHDPQMKVQLHQQPSYGGKKIAGQPALDSIDITPKMRESILKGQPAYAQGGAVATPKPSFAELNALAAEHGANSPHFTRAYEAYTQNQEPDEKLQKAAGGAVDHHPTEAQKAAGNYAKERTSFQGIPISIENKKGSTRTGRDAGGKPWSVRVPADYGYIRGTTGADKDHVDCYVGPKPDSNLVVVVNQRDHRSGKFDEHKCLLGFPSEREAIATYLNGFSDGRAVARMDSVETMSIDAFKHWLKNGRTTKKANGPRIVDQALGLVRGQA